MSLNFRLSGIKDYLTVCYEPAKHDRPDEGIKAGESVMTLVTQAMIHATMAAGMGRITEANALDFFIRASLFEKVNGAMRRGPSKEGIGAEPVFFTLDEVRQHVGLTTNVSDESDTKWRKRLLDNYASDVRWKHRVKPSS